MIKKKRKEKSEVVYLPERPVKLLKPRNLRQAALISSIINNNITIAEGAAGTGKAQPLSEPVLTPDGWSIMGDISIGDYVISDKGTPIKVIDTFTSENLEMYEVIFSDGSYARCCIDHLWEIQTAKLAHDGNVRIMSLRDMLPNIRKDKTKSSYKYRVRLTKPIEFTEKKQSISAWSLGYILGNGHSNKQLIVSIGSDDFYNILPKFKDYEVLSSALKKDGVNIISITKRFRDEYNLLGLHKVKSLDKFIPYNYLYGSIDQRKDILAGLLDSDGSCTNNKCRFSTSSKKLANNIAELVRSLGGYAKISFKEREGRINIEYNVQIRTPFNPFTLERKALSYRVLVSDKEKSSKRIVSANYIGNETGKCLLVDSENHLYLTRDYTVTHNTFIAASKALDLLQAGIVSKIIVSRPYVSAGEKMGFLPGDIAEKYAPYLEPYMDIFAERIGKVLLAQMLSDGRIEAKPVNFMQGKTFSDAIILVDEVENATLEQIKLILTRMGENCRAVLMGDLAQTYTRESGFKQAIEILRIVPRLGIVHFDVCDVVRSETCRAVLEAFEIWENK